MTRPQSTDELEPLNSVAVDVDNSPKDTMTEKRTSKRRHSSSRRRSGSLRRDSLGKNGSVQTGTARGILPRTHPRRQSKTMDELVAVLDADTVEVKGPSCAVLTPSGMVSRVWTWIMILTLGYVGVYFPVSVCFFAGQEFTVLDYFSGIVVFGIYCADIILNFFTSYKGTDGREVTKLSKIAKNYFLGWFVIDLISTVPLGPILSFFGILPWGKNFLYLLPLLRLTEAPRLFHLARMFPAFNKGSWLHQKLALRSAYNQTTKITRAVLSMALFAHCVACVWAYIGMVQAAYNYGWMSAGIYKSSFWTKYLWSMYWAISQICIVGSDIIATTKEERIFSTAVLVTSIFAWIYTASLVVAKMMVDNQAEINAASRSVLIDDFLNTCHLEKRADLKENARNHLLGENVKGYRLSMSDHKRMLEKLPIELKESIIVEQNRDLLPFMTYLHNKTVSFQAQIFEASTVMRFRRNENIASKGEVAAGVFFLVHGSIFVKEDSMEDEIKLNAGAYFGDAGALERNHKYPVTITAATSCEFRVVSYEKFRSILTNFPDAHSELRKHIAANAGDESNKAATEGPGVGTLLKNASIGDSTETFEEMNEKIASVDERVKQVLAGFHALSVKLAVEKKEEEAKKEVTKELSVDKLEAKRIADESKQKIDNEYATIVGESPMPISDKKTLSHVA